MATKRHQNARNSADVQINFEDTKQKSRICGTVQNEIEAFAINVHLKQHLNNDISDCRITSNPDMILSIKTYWMDECTDFLKCF